MGKEVPMENGAEISQNEAASGFDLWPKLKGYAHVPTWLAAVTPKQVGSWKTSQMCSV